MRYSLHSPVQAGGAAFSPSGAQGGASSRPCASRRRKLSLPPAFPVSRGRPLRVLSRECRAASSFRRVRTPLSLPPDFATPAAHLRGRACLLQNPLRAAFFAALYVRFFGKTIKQLSPRPRFGDFLRVRVGVPRLKPCGLRLRRACPRPRRLACFCGLSGSLARSAYSPPRSRGGRSASPAIVRRLSRSAGFLLPLRGMTS